MTRRSTPYRERLRTNLRCSLVDAVGPDAGGKVMERSLDEARKLIEVVASAVDRGLVSGSLLSILSDTVMISIDDHLVEVEELRHTYSRRIRRFPAGSFEYGEIERLISALDSVEGSRVRMIPVVKDGVTKTLVLTDARFEDFLYWSPMWNFGSQ